MKLINRDTDCAVQALIYLARSGGKIRDTSRIQKELELPRPFLRKILQILKHKGIVESVKGNGGGFRLNRKPEEIFLLDLMRVFQGDFRFTECLFRKKLCRNIGRCPIRKQLGKVETLLVSELSGVTVRTLLNSMDQKS
jgi:Rrf2 family protein